NSDGSFQYVPTVGYVGSEAFAYEALGTDGSLAIAEVTLQVAPVIVKADNMSATEGASTGSTLVATFTCAGGLAPIASYAATIGWGVGTTSTVTSTATPSGQIVVDSNGGYDVQASHTYGEEGSFPLTVTITDAAGITFRAQAQATVADATLTGAAQNISTTEGLKTFTVATFSDADPNGTPSDYTATITWDDG